MLPTTTTRLEALGAPHHPATGDLPWMRRNFRDYMAPFTVLLLLYAGFFKADPLLSWVPIDLTLLGALLTLAGIIAVIVTSSVPRGTGVVLAVWATFTPMAILHAGNPYGSTKTLHLFTLTLLAALAPLFLIRSGRRQEIWVLMQIVLGTILAIGTYLAPVSNMPPDVIYRTALEGSNPIGAGRAAGVAVVGCLCLALAGHRWRVWLVLLGGGAAVPLFMSGSRGPVLAAVISVFMVAALAPTSGIKRFTRIGLVGVGVALTYLYIQGSTTGGTGRIAQTLLQGVDQDTSSQVRLMLWRYTSSYIFRHPWGAGWGGLQHVSGFNLLNTEGLVYPHNVLLEVTGEAGWIAGAAVIFFLWSGLRQLRTAAVRPFPAALFGIAVFFTLNAMVSGDVNDNRTMWASVAVAWVVSIRNGTHRPGQDNPQMNRDRYGEEPI
jgi:O-antigen ligase